MSSIRVEEVSEKWTYTAEDNTIKTQFTDFNVDYVEVFLILSFFVSLFRFISSFCINKQKEKDKDE